MGVKKTLDDADLPLRRLAAKKADTERRLGRNFVVLFWDKKRKSLCFLMNQENRPEFFQNDNFFSISVGASNFEVSEATEIIKKASTSVASYFDALDFRSIVALENISKYLRQELHDLRQPEAVALEYVLLEPKSNILMIVRYSGEFEIYEGFDNNCDTVFVTGTYDKSFIELIKTKVKELRTNKRLSRFSSSEKEKWFKKELDMKELTFTNAADIIKKTPK